MAVGGGRSWRKKLAIALAIVVAVGVAFSLALAPLARRLLLSRLNREPGQVASVGRVSVAPLSGKVVVRDLRIDRQAEGAERRPFAAVSSVEAFLELGSLLRHRKVVSVTLDGPELYWPPPGQQTSPQVPDLLLKELRIHRGKAHFRDTGSPGLGALELTEIEAKASQIGREASPGEPYPTPFELTAAVEGQGRLQMQGKAAAKTPPAFRVEVHLQHFPLSAVAGAMKDQLHLELREGTLALDSAMETVGSFVEGRAVVSIQGLELHMLADPGAVLRELDRLRGAAGALKGSAVGVGPVSFSFRIPISGDRAGTLEAMGAALKQAFIQGLLTGLQSALPSIPSPSGPRMPELPPVPQLPGWPTP